MRTSLSALAAVMTATLAVALCQPHLAFAQVGVSISVNMPVYPEMTVVPGYPVYYDPMAESNYFFYDGMFWVYANDGWYSSSWYNGPWVVADPLVVPVFLYRIPVGYYRSPPAFFAGWAANEPPRWGDHYGASWQARHAGWDHWDRHGVPAAAPLPTYQRQYSGDRYPRSPDQQRSLVAANYKYHPRETVNQQRLLAHGGAQAARPAEHHAPPPESQHSIRQETPREAPHATPHEAPHPAPAPEHSMAPHPAPAPEHSMAPRPASPEAHEQRPAAPERREEDHHEDRH
jgi:hypothetical protein